MCVLTGFVFISPTMFIVFIIYQEWHSVYSCICNLELWKKQIYTITDCPGKSAALLCWYLCGALWVDSCRYVICDRWTVITTGEWQFIKLIDSSYHFLSPMLLLLCVVCKYFGITCLTERLLKAVWMWYCQVESASWARSLSADRLWSTCHVALDESDMRGVSHL